MSKATRGYRIFALVFLVLFVAGTVVHALVLREESKRRQLVELRYLASHLPPLTAGAAVKAADANAFFQTVETRNERLRALIVFSGSTPVLFWGDQTLTEGEGDIVRLTDPDIVNERLEYLAGPQSRLSALYTVFGDEEVFYVARLSLFVLLGFAILSIIIQIASRNASAKSTARPQASAPPAASSDVARQQEQPAPVRSAPVHPSPAQRSPAENPAVAVATETPVETVAPPQQGDMVYPRAQLDERLASELHRAGSNQTDLSLALVAAARSTPEADFHALLREHFIYRDLLFRDGRKLCWVLLSQLDLDSAMKEIETFIALGKKRLSSQDDNDSKGSVILAGVTSRNGRIVGPSTLYKECKAALRKAGPQSPLVGFRTDPEKYRNYILKKSG